MFSQNDEEDVILAAFERLRPESPRFMDIGAFDGKAFSNTHQLALNGWSGVSIEPSFQAFKALAELYKNNPDIKLVNALVGFNWKLDRFWSSPDAVATSDPQHYERWKEAGQFQEIWMPELPIAELVRVFHGPYNFINIDCEGEATERIFNWLAKEKEALWMINGEWRPFMGAGVVCVEYDGSRKEAMCETAMAHARMGLIHATTENLIFERRA